MGMATKETLADMIAQRRLVQVPSGLMSKVCALPFCAAPSHFLALSQFRVFRLSSNKDRDVGVCVFPECEETLIGSTRFDVLAR